MSAKPSSVLAQALHAFFADYLPRQRAFSPHTLQSYRDSLKLLLQFVAGPKPDPSQLNLEALPPKQILAFLHHLEAKRHSRPSTRNVAAECHSQLLPLRGQPASTILGANPAGAQPAL